MSKQSLAATERCYGGSKLAAMARRVKAAGATHKARSAAMPTQSLNATEQCCIGDGGSKLAAMACRVKADGATQ